MNANPMTMVMTPPRRWSSSRFSCRTLISPKTEAVARTKTTVKPVTNRRAAPVTRILAAVLTRVSPAGSVEVSAPAIPAR